MKYSINSMFRCLFLGLLCSIALISLLEEKVVAGQPIQAVRFTYDANGNIATRTDAAGVVTSYKYDPLDRLVAIEYPDKSSVRYEYDKVGRIIRMTDHLGTSTYEYDIHDRLISYTNPNNLQLKYEYGPLGLLKGITYPDGTSVHYNYDSKLQLQSVSIPTGMVQYHYDQSGRLEQRSLPNGVDTNYSYDENDRLVEIVHKNPNGTPILGFKYQFDESGNFVRTVRTEIGTTSETHYSYDNKSRIVNVALPDGQKIHYEYGSNGKKTLMSASKEKKISYQYDDRGFLTAMKAKGGRTTFYYNLNGNLVEGKGPSGRVKCFWDYEGRMTRLESDKDVVDFSYDGNGLLLRKTLNGKTTKYISDISGPVPVVVSECASPCSFCFLGSDPFAPLGYSDATGNEHYFLGDGLSAVAGLSDQNGDLLESYPFDNMEGKWAKDALGDLAKKFVESGFEKGFNSLATRPDAWQFTGGIVQTGSQYEFDMPYFYRGPARVIGHAGGIGLEILKWGDVAWSVTEAYKEREYASAAVKLTKPFASSAVSAFLIPAGASAATTIIAGAAVGFATSQVYQAADLTARIGTANFRKSLREKEIGTNIDRYIDSLYAKGKSFYEVRNALLNSTVLKAAGISKDRIDEYLPSVGNSGFGGLRPVRRFSPTIDTGPKISPLPGLKGGGAGDRMSGGSAAVGGISLDRAAQVMVDLRDVRGATFDPATGQLVLIGRKDLSFPEMNLDDLVVAIRSIYSGQEPSMSIEPCTPGVQDGCMKVLYNGRFQLPDHADWGWVEFNHNSGVDNAAYIKTEAPITFGSTSGWTMFEADRYLKTATISKNNLNTEEPFQTKVPHFMSLLDRYAARAAADHTYVLPSSGECRIDTVADQNLPSSCSRLWFVPEDLVVKKSPDGNSMEFEPVKIVIDARFVRFDGNGRMVDVPGQDDDVDAFVSHFNKHYMDFAQEKPELMALVQLAKIVGLVRWIRDNNIPLDLSWLQRYEVSPHNTPKTTSGETIYAARIDTRQIGIYGGVEFPSKNIYVAGRKDTALLGEAALESRPSVVDQSWEFEHQGERLEAVALHLAPVPIQGGFSTERTDAKIPLAPGLSAEFKVQYSSVDSVYSPYGKGWSLDLPRLTFMSVPVQGSDLYTIKAVLNEGETQTVFDMTTDGAFRPKDQQSSYEVMGLIIDEPYTPKGSPDIHVVPALPGSPVWLQNSSNQKFKCNGCAVIRKDGAAITFDSSGNIIGIRDAVRNELKYKYSKDDSHSNRKNKARLISISSPLGKGISLEYDKSGKMVRLKTSDGDSVHYQYDESERLARVSTGNNELLAGYGYDSGGRLGKIIDASGQVAQEIAYDRIGRMTATVFGSENVYGINYDDRKNAITYSYPSGGTGTRYFDDQNHLLAEADSEGHKIRFGYDAEGRVTKITDRKEHTTKFHYNQSGFLSEVISPLGDRTLFLINSPRGWVEGLTVVDPADRITFYRYNPRGNVTSVSNGYLLSNISAKGQIRYREVDPETISYKYDTAGNLVSITYPDMSSSKFVYDTVGNLVEVRLPGNEKLQTTFDEFARLTQVMDSEGDTIEYKYDNLGQLAELKTPVGTREYKYSGGRLVSYFDVSGHSRRYVSGSEVNSVSFEYMKSGMVGAVKDRRSGRIEYEYDKNGRVVAISEAPFILMGAR